jgi:hypothetical protein
MGKYGTNLEGFGAFEGGVNNDKGSPLVATNSDGETSLLFGPAALRETQAGVANGDFAIPPDDAEATITEENPLPYWTFTDVNSAGAITCAVVADASAGSGNVLRWTINSGTLTGKSAQISRYIPIATSRDRALTIVPDAYVSEALGTNARFRLTYSYVKQDLTTTGTGATATKTTVGTLVPSVATTNTAPSDAAYVYLVITAETTGTTAALTGDLAEVKLRSFFSGFFITDSSDPATYAPAGFEQGGGNLLIGANGGAGNTGIVGPLFSVSGELQGAGVTTDLVHGVNLQRTTTLTINTSTDASATAITWSSAVKNTTLYAYWASGSTISIPLTGWYNITCHLTFASGTGYAARLYALIGSTVIAESEMQAAANTTNDTVGLATIAYLTAGNSLVFRASASTASKTIGGSGRNRCSVVYIGNMSS